MRAGAAGLVGRAKVARKATARTAEVARTATAAAARTASATAKAAGTTAAAVRTAATARTAKAAAAEPSPVEPSPVEPTTATPPLVLPTEPVGAVIVEPPAVELPALDAPPVEAPAVEDVLPPAEQGSSSEPHRRVARVRRRSALYAAAALAGALSISAAAVGETTAMAETGAVRESISVADALGIEAEEARPIVTAETTDRLGELVASRAERDEQEAHAAKLQADADEEAREEAERAAAAAAEAARPDAVLPVEGGRFTSGFGPRWGTQHSGIDLAAPMRTPEYAAVDGVVLEAGPASGFGLAVWIQHENGDVTVYGHMDEILVQAGQVVRAGDTIALLGNRGQSTGPHLHFEVHEGGIDGTKIDPVPWLEARGVELP